MSYGSSFVYVAFGSAELQPWNSPPVDCEEESNTNRQGKSFSTSRSELWMISFKQHIQNPKAHPFNFSFRTFGRYRRHGDIFHIVLKTTFQHRAATQSCYNFYKKIWKEYGFWYKIFNAASLLCQWHLKPMIVPLQTIKDKIVWSDNLTMSQLIFLQLWSTSVVQKSGICSPNF